MAPVLQEQTRAVPLSMYYEASHRFPGVVCAAQTVHAPSLVG